MPTDTGGDQQQVSLAVFSDYECPFCRSGDAVLVQLQADTTIENHLHHLPLPNHPFADRLQRLSICGKRHGVMSVVHAALISQQEWQERGDFTSVLSPLDPTTHEAVARCAANGEAAKEIESDIALARRLGIKTATAIKVDRVWRSDLERPLAIVAGTGAFGDELFIADRNVVHRVKGVAHEVIGSEGDGPGEFRTITGISFIPPDTVLVWDCRQFRITAISLSTRTVITATVPLPPGAGDVVPLPLAPVNGKVMIGWRDAVIQTNGPPQRIVIAVFDRQTSAFDQIADVEGIAFVRGAGPLVPRDPFGPRANIGTAGRYVLSGTGAESSVNLFDRETSNRKVVQLGVSEVAVTTHDRNPSPPQGLLNQRQQQLLAYRSGVHEYGETRATYDLFWWDQKDR